MNHALTPFGFHGKGKAFNHGLREATDDGECGKGEGLAKPPRREEERFWEFRTFALLCGFARGGTSRSGEISGQYIGPFLSIVAILWNIPITGDANPLSNHSLAATRRLSLGSY